MRSVEVGMLWYIEKYEWNRNGKHKVLIMGIKGQQIFRFFSLFGDQLTCEPLHPFSVINWRKLDTKWIFRIVCTNSLFDLKLYTIWLGIYVVLRIVFKQTFVFLVGKWLCINLFTYEGDIHPSIVVFCVNSNKIIE